MDVMLKYTLVRILGVIEIPFIYMLLSLQAQDPFWSDVWFCVGMIKFLMNGYADFLVNKQREEHIKSMQEFIDKTKRKK